MFKKLILCLTILSTLKCESVAINNKTTTLEKNLKVEIRKANGSIMYQDLIEFINDGKLKISNTHSRKQAIMVLGLTGVGKSTLVNYLNDIPLKCVKINGVWRIDLENPNNTLTCGFKIGHGNSETLYPSACTPSGKLFSFIDNPGFQDNRGFEIEIANSFFREQIIENVEDLKFLILLNYGDVIDRRVQFFENVKRFSDFLGIFNSNDSNVLRKFSKSVGIIVSKVNNDGDSDLDMKEMLKDLLLDSLDRNKILDLNETFIFKQILQNDQIGIFSNPRKTMILDDTQKNQLLKMIDRLDYIKKQDAEIRVSIDRSNVPKLNLYLADNYEKFEKNFEILLEKGFKLFIDDIVKNPPNASFIPLIKKFFFYFSENGTKQADFNNFMNSLEPEFMDLKSKNQVFEDKKLLDYFMNLMPNEFKKSFSLERNWINVNLVSKLNDLVTNKLFKYILDENKKLNLNFVSKLEKSLEDYSKNSISQAYEIDELKQIQNFFDDFNAQLKNELTEDFIMNLKSEILTSNEKNHFISQLKSLSLFNELLPNGMKLHISSRESFNGLMLKLKTIINELIKLEHFEEYNFGNKIFIYKGSFAKISSILSLVNNAANVVDLKSIHIYLTNSLVIDSFKINTQRYSTHSPDLIIVSPKVKFNEKANVDLSSHTSVFYPNNQVKALNGNGFGVSGEDGLAGLPGYNGGRLVVFSDEILDWNNLVFKSKGSNGGPGQNGGDGTNSQMGPDASYDQVKLSSQYGDVTIYMASPSTPNKGGNGGKGGIGGLSGNNGEFSLISLRDKKTVKKSFLEKGSDGPNGLPGAPGLGGRFGKTAVKKVTRIEKSIPLTKEEIWSIFRERARNTNFLRLHILMAEIEKMRKKVIENISETYMIDNFNSADSGFYQYTPSLKGRNYPSVHQKIDMKSITDYYLNFILDTNKLVSFSALSSNNFINRIKDFPVDSFLSQS